jgi:cyclic pyranopterin monophosphate synthase
MTGDLTHIGDDGSARMVEVGAKPETARSASAACTVVMSPDTAARLAAADLPKGDAIAVARIAGIQAAKRTAELIPLCHPLRLTKVDVEVAVDPAGTAEVVAHVSAQDRTGVEMEALVAVSTAALTLYDMVKAVQRDVRITDVRVIAKSGGSSGDFDAP